jgi:hypothetical protein
MIFFNVLLLAKDSAGLKTGPGFSRSTRGFSHNQSFTNRDGFFGKLFLAFLQPQWE